MQYFMFQLDEASAVDILANVEDGHLMMNLPFRNHRDAAGVGDQVVLWLQGPDGRAYAIGEITGPEVMVSMPKSFREPEGAQSLRPAFPVEFVDYLDRDVHRSDLKRLDEFSGFPFAQANLRNPFVLTSEQYAAVVRLGTASEAVAN